MLYNIFTVKLHFVLKDTEIASCLLLHVWIHVCFYTWVRQINTCLVKVETPNIVWHSYVKPIKQYQHLQPKKKKPNLKVFSWVTCLPSFTPLLTLIPLPLSQPHSGHLTAQSQVPAQNEYNNRINNNMQPLRQPVACCLNLRSSFRREKYTGH